MKNKIKASALHLLLSFVVISAFLGFAILYWYPDPLLQVSGLKDIMIILISVDLILGPLLTFIIFKPKKPSLKLDLAVIASLQIAALAYGMYTVYQGHPVYVAYAVDRFTLVSARDVKPENARYDEFKKSKFSGPTLVYAKRPEDPKVISDLTFSVLSGEPDIDARPEYYEPYNQYLHDVLSRSIDPDALFYNEHKREKLDHVLKKHDKEAKDFAYLPLSGKEKDVVWVISRESGEPVDTIDVNPWDVQS